MEAIDWLTTIGSAYVEILHNKFQEKCTAHSQVHQSFKVSKSTFRDLISIIDGLNQWFEALQDQDETSVDFRSFERQQARRESMDSDEEGDSVQMDFDCFDQVIRDVHLVPLFFGNNQKSQPDLKEIVQTRWARRRQEDFMSLADFCDAVADLELPPKGSEETDGCSLSSGQPRTSYPIVRLNGKIIPKANAEEKIDSQNRQSWVYVVKGPLKVTHLEVGLRRRLRDLVAKGGDKVLVEIITDNHVESESNICDTTTLQHDNNHRCSWPELKLRPFDVKEQLQVVFTRLNSVVPHDDGEGKESEARPVEVAEVCPQP
ncbi:hypothetical protein GUITHDRAFT_142367 [Guillardia theta CCMP2712]|uniref:Uncharacterized protein n=1 Tax=Guillardia theta (strain CCMP2712) TaxID=905079 RepID=L1IXH1_GUITC|nr:hypothetical protein GUITHDRAFT_142367 [Guillardia theta CCMP2712]EKX40968.1 hypothetical protein GUITHDRAFT_142367 [Guillardia theta CCMP2712]|eukprot:XP_005827948.1 hypothetical protein GUITHDRAFT_142367 [Guillardia theta CCMP2712]